MEGLKYPYIGGRTFKTALATALCAWVYYYTGRSPAFACIGVIFGMGRDMQDARLNGFNRLFGTIIGGAVGILLFSLYTLHVPDGRYTLQIVPYVFVGTVLLVLMCQKFWVGGVQPGAVVLCILLFNTPVDSYINYAMDRIFDTAVGVLFALAITCLFPRGWMRIWPVRIKGALGAIRTTFVNLRDAGFRKKMP